MSYVFYYALLRIIIYKNMIIIININYYYYVLVPCTRGAVRKNRLSQFREFSYDISHVG